jgi:hypothetical protein
MTAVSASDTSKSIMQDAAIEIAVNHLLNMMAKKAVMLLKALLIDLLKYFKMVFDTLIMLRLLRPPRPVDRSWHGLFSQKGEEKERPQPLYCKYIGQPPGFAGGRTEFDSSGSITVWL